MLLLNQRQDRPDGFISLRMNRQSRMPTGTLLYEAGR